MLYLVPARGRRYEGGAASGPMIGAAHRAWPGAANARERAGACRLADAAGARWAEGAGGVSTPRPHAGAGHGAVAARVQLFAITAVLLS
ncbi:hypothetical protein BCD48_24270 [Pseudofrankia sp. BMG5.36]|nr:hypothetical protein BCD48_24270 [Pseudofrankia sp. BMG5.36]